jgi:hypothetical protein
MRNPLRTVESRIPRNLAPKKLEMLREAFSCCWSSVKWVWVK